MPEPLDEAVAHLRALSIHLNDVTDRATGAVRRVEAFLNDECRLGLSVYVPVTAGEPDAPTLQLGYARHGERFRVVVRTLTYRERDGRVVRREGSNAPLVEDEEQVAWSECARGTKLDAFRHLPALLTALQAQVAQTITNADAAVTAAQCIVSVLGPAPEAAEGEDRCAGREEGRRGRHGGHGHHHGEHDHRHHDGERRHDGPSRSGEGRGEAPRRPEGRGWDKA